MAIAQVYIEPFEDILELSAFCPRSGVILLEDVPGQLAALVEYMIEKDRWLPAVCYSEEACPQQVARAILHGATNYVNWPCSAEELIAAAADAEENGQRASSFNVRRSRARARLKRLTRREREVLDAITDGLSNREIGERLEISARTVEIHRANMLHKIGAEHTSEAIRVAIEASLVGLA